MSSMGVLEHYVYAYQTFSDMYIRTPAPDAWSDSVKHVPKRETGMDALVENRSVITQTSSSVDVLGMM